MQLSRFLFRSGPSECCGYLYRPSVSAGPLPCIVMAHGFGGTQDGSLARTAQDFARFGFAAFTFDYRGFGESGGDRRQVIVIRDQMEDWHAAIAHARSLPGVDPERIAIWGSSLGGAHVVDVAVHDPSIKAVVAQVPFNGFPSKVEGRSPGDSLKLMGTAVKDWWRGRTGKAPIYVPTIGHFGDPAVIVIEDADAVVASLRTSSWRNEIAPRVLLDLVTWYRPGRRARRLRMPILVCLAQQDRHTPAALGRKIADNAPLGELRRYPCSHFDFYDDTVRQIVAADQASFLKTNLFGLNGFGREKAALPRQA